MKKQFATLCGLAFLAACTGSWETNYEAAKEASVTRGWNVKDITVIVPEELTTTEENSFAPNADIVWHGDPFGNRKAQVAAIIETGMRRGTRGLRGGRGVDLQVVLEEFHALTPKARAEAPSAVHNITYTVQIFDDRTGEAISQPERIRADLPAFTGSSAFAAIEQGQTQKIRITNHIELVTEGWLGIGPDPRQSFGSVGR
ncbi:MAG: DUF6778 family protein [Pseudomonadota bacterium]